MLEEHHRKTDISKIAGSVIYIIGAALVVIGLAITPFKLGGVAGIGISLACIGIVIAVGVPFFYSYVIENMKIEEAQKKYNKDHCQLKNLQNVIKEMKKIVEYVYKRYTKIEKNADNFVSAMTLLYSNSTKGSLCTIVTKLAMADSLEVDTSALRNGGAKAALALGKRAINVILLTSLIQSSSNSKSVSMTITINKLLKHASELGKQMKKVNQNIKKKKLQTSISF